MNLEQIAYHTTSRKTKPNAIMKTNITPFLKQNNVRTILDYGCGKFLRDSLYLTQQGFHVDAVDLPEQIERIKPNKDINISTNIPKNNYDAALLNFVIQVLPTQQQREEVLNKVYDSIANQGYFVLSVRNMKDVREVTENSTPFNDGFLMQTKPQPTFLRGYEREELIDIIDSFNLKLIKIFRSSGSFVSLSRK